MKPLLAGSTVILAALLSGIPAMAAFQLELKNGRVVTGDDLEREPGKYVLIMKDGRRLTIEMDQVAVMRILGDDVVIIDTHAPVTAPDTAAEDEAKGKAPVGVPLAGGDLSERVTRGEATTVGGAVPPKKPDADPEKPAAEPQNLAGAAPGSPLAPGEWRPASNWPAKSPDWPKDGWISWVPDPTWTPQSDFAADPKANEFNPSIWSKPAKDPNWYPTDGFRKTDPSVRIITATTGAGVASKPASAAQPALKALQSAGAPAATGDDGAGALAVAQGDAAWYGEAYRGRTTASGRLFDPDELTAAHASLPFGTLVMVTRLDEPARSVVVEIIDRGTGGRLLNLSRGAAAALDMLKMGVAPVRMAPLPAAEKPSQAGKP
jgi:rare lipoprotein A